MQTYNSPYFFRHMSKTVVDSLLAHPQQRNLGNHFAMSPDHIKNARLQLFVLRQSPVVFLITHQFRYSDLKEMLSITCFASTLIKARIKLVGSSPDEAINVRLSITLTCSLSSCFNSSPSNTFDFIA